MNLSHLGVLELSVSEKNLSEQIPQHVIVLYNKNFLTAETVLELMKKQKYSDYYIVIPKSLYLGLFCNSKINKIVS